MRMKIKLLGFLSGAALALVAGAAPARAHCDTLDGPVVKDAQAALASGDVQGVLKWVAPEQEAVVREVFRQALAVRALGAQARDLVDRFFFETVVRLHRAGEGAPFTGLKPAGTEVDPAVAAADQALATGSADALVRMLAADLERGLRQRFARVSESRRTAGDSLEKGREFVAAYVDFTHYAERLRAAAGQGEAAGDAHRH